MPTCATLQKVTESAPIYNLILPVPDTDFRDSLDEVDELFRFARSEVNSMDKVSRRMVKFQATGVRHPKYAQGMRSSRPEVALNREL